MHRHLPHRRWNPLQQSWVLVSPHRALRPWKGEVIETTVIPTTEYSPECYLCPGNTRAGQKTNPDYTSVYVFDNDFAALIPSVDTESNQSALNGLVRSEQDRGICRVICYSPFHNRSFSTLCTAEMLKVIDEWENQYKELSGYDFIRHIQIFENKGEMMGCSNTHPHGQIWATEEIPDIPLKSILSQEKYHQEHSRSMLIDYCHWEREQRERVVIQNDRWTAVIPFWAVWPYETMIIPHRQAGSIDELTVEEKSAWAAINKQLITIYDKLFNASFPYSMGIYQKPVQKEALKGFCMHQAFFPPLLRSALIKKYMVGYELCAEPQRDLTPESAAEKLRSCL